MIFQILPSTEVFFLLCLIGLFEITYSRSDRYEIFWKDYVFEELSSQEKIQLNMTRSFEVGILILSREVRIPLLSLNKLGEKSQAAIIFGNFVNKP